MRKLFTLLLAVLLLTAPALGCGHAAQPGINSNKDKPKSAEKER